jgi:hypothetical protein
MRRTLFVLCAVGLLTGCSLFRRGDSAPAPGPAPLSQRALTPEERALLSTTFAAVMKNPNTVQFKWNPIGQPDDKGLAQYCGMINGTNDFGNYVGFQPFSAQVFFVGGKIVTAKLTLIGYDPASAQAVERDCKTYGIDPHTAS